MGIFDLFKKNCKKLSSGTGENDVKENISAEMAIQKITAVISENDSAVMEMITTCLKDTEAYFKEHKDAFFERGIGNFDDMPLGAIQWLAMVDILAENQYVCERDWKDELDDFLYFVRGLKGIKSKELPLDTEWFDETGDIMEWCTMIDARWEALGMCLAGIDIASDSYVLFPCENDKINKLNNLAKIVSFRIDCLKNF